MNHEVFELDVHDPEAVAEYERAFYETFAPLTHNQLIRWLWHWDDTEKRLRTRVPYGEQTIFLQRDETGALNRAMAVGTKLETAQSAEYGFDIPRRPENCESLVLIVRRHRDIAPGLAFYGICRERLARRGFEWMYATGAPRILRIHNLVGATLLESREIEGEIRNFVRIPLAPK
jgi:hypothetical protein